VKISLIVGTRPQIIKSQPLIKEILSKKIKLNIIHTGQHYDYQMSKAFFDELKIRNPDYNLGVKNGSSAQQLSQIVSKLEKPLKKFGPDFVLVPGDTRSALASALCANIMGYKVVHIEAGARSGDFTLEEEINRRIIDNCSSILFAPTKYCYENLKKEGILGEAHFVGDTMYDVFLKYKKILKLNKSKKRKFILMTIHRKNNIENYQKIKKILGLIQQVTKLGHEVVFPIHPHTKKQIKSFGLSLIGINTIEPVKYSKMLKLLSEAKLMITDSGGLQKESYWSETPCITIRPSTEWIETMQGGNNILLTKITNSSISLVEKMLSKKNRFNQKLIAKKFGGGKASKKIVSVLKNY